MTAARGAWRLLALIALLSPSTRAVGSDDQPAAESDAIRETAWGWWESVALTRLASGARVVLVQTRWHMDDLAGRITSRPSPLKWRQLIIPAIAVAGKEPDPLGRAPEEEMESVRDRAPGYFKNRRATMSAYTFSSIYQQNPVAAEGNIFRRSTFRYWRPMEAWADGRQRISLEGLPVTMADTWRFITMDFAASTRSSADWTVAAVWAIDVSGNVILLDRARSRVEDHDHFALTAPLIARWQVQQVFVESGWWSKTFVKDAQDRGVPVAPMMADTDKVTRAIPASGLLHSGKVFFPAEAGWLDEWADELAAFNKGEHDDQVDVFSYAARIKVAEWTPARPPPLPRPDAYQAAVNAAAAASTGNGHEPLDIMGLQY